MEINIEKTNYEMIKSFMNVVLNPLKSMGIQPENEKLFEQIMSENSKIKLLDEYLLEYRSKLLDPLIRSENDIREVNFAEIETCKKIFNANKENRAKVILDLQFLAEQFLKSKGFTDEQLANFNENLKDRNKVEEAMELHRDIYRQKLKKQYGNKTVNDIGVQQAIDKANETHNMLQKKHKITIKK